MAQYYGKPYQHELGEGTAGAHTPKFPWNDRLGHPYRVDHRGLGPKGNQSNGDGTTGENVMVKVSLEGRQFQLRMAVAKREQLNEASRLDAGPGLQGQDTCGIHQR